MVDRGGERVVDLGGETVVDLGGETVVDGDACSSFFFVSQD